MLRTILFFSLMWLSLLASLLLFIPYPVLLIPSLKRKRNKYIYFWTSRWAKLVLWIAGARITVKGRENIPPTGSFALISNHQGYMDIPVLMQVFPYPLSFVAKRELMKVPIINLWLLALDCPVIDRSRPLRSKAIITGRLGKNSGNPIILFPEGTRSRGAASGKWKKGGIKILERSGIQQVYVTIDGTYKLWEKNKRIQSANIMVDIAKPV